MADDANVQPGVHGLPERLADGGLDPCVVVAEGTATQPREQHHIRGTALGIEDRRPERGFVRRIEHQAGKGRPMNRRYTAVSDWQGRAERLGNELAPGLKGIGDLDMGLDGNTQLAGQRIHLDRPSDAR